MNLHGSGLGLRRELLDELVTQVPVEVDFLELAPENWVGMGGRSRRALDALAAQRPLVCHGLSLDLGGMRPLDTDWLGRIRDFLDHYRIALYTEHLSWCGDDGHLYDLLPLPCTRETVAWVAARIRQTQDLLGRRIAIENASYYAAPPGAEMSEAEFIGDVIAAADCDLHLDVNNIYVNSCNFGFDPLAFLRSLPLSRVVYMHVAGHFVEPDGLRIDTHGASVIDPVWALLDEALIHTGPVPVCLERDFNLPAMGELRRELQCVRGALERAEIRRVVPA